MKANIQISMSGVGNCHDNAVAESPFGTLEAECVTGQFAAFAVTHTTHRSNRQRLHSTLGYLSPAELRTAIKTFFVFTKSG